MTKTICDICGEDFTAADKLRHLGESAVVRLFADPHSDMNVEVAISRRYTGSGSLPMPDICCTCTLDLLHRLDKRYKPDGQDSWNKRSQHSSDTKAKEQGMA